MAPPNIKALLAFTRVAATGSLSQAAANLGLAQSAVSRYIAQLEAQFGGPLFYRTGRGVICTELGNVLLGSAQDVIDAADALSVAAHDHASVPSGSVSIGLLHGAASYLPTRLYAHLRERLPRVQLQIIEGHSGEIEEWTASGEVSMGILNRYRPGKWAGAHKLLASAVCLVARPGSFARAPTAVRFAALARYPLIVPVMPNALRLRLEELAQRHGMPLDIAIEASGNTTVKSLVLDHGLFGVMPQLACARELREGTLEVRPIAERAFKANTLLITSTRRTMTKAAREVMRAIPPLARTLVRDGVWIES